MKVKVIRSLRRRRTISAQMKGRVLELRVPYFLPLAKVNYYQRLMQKRLQKKYLLKNDSFLEKRAANLVRKHLAGYKIPDYQIVWSERQKRIFGICNKRRKKIKISSRLKKAPLWVVDYVVFHELVHLLHSGHGQDFWRVVKKYPRTELARAFLRGASFQLDS